MKAQIIHISVLLKPDGEIKASAQRRSRTIKEKGGKKFAHVAFNEHQIIEQSGEKFVITVAKQVLAMKIF